jgi:biotin operon repressor
MQGIYIPIHILQDNNLNLQEKIILAITSTMDKGLYMSNQAIGDLLGLSKGRVSQIITSLAKKGYVKVVLEYYQNSKQVKKRTVFLAKVAQTVKEVISTIKKAASNVASKAKEIRQQYTYTKQKVGTEQVEQVTFAEGSYRATKGKVNKFNLGATHDWNFDELERLEREYVQRIIEGFSSVPR